MEVKEDEIMKNAYLVIGIVAAVTLLTGIPVLYEGIAARGFGGVNYGRVIFPLLISGVCFWRYRQYE